MKLQTIVITGASSGIGRALAIAYAKPGVCLLLLARSLSKLHAVQVQCEQQGAKVKVASLDVTDSAPLQAWLQAEDALWPVDLLIVNAGSSLRQIQAQYADDDLLDDIAVSTAENQLVAVHMQGMINTVHALLPLMRARGCGQIAIMSSMNAFFTVPQSVCYGAVKAGMLHYALALRAQLASDGIFVNAICPGWVESALTQLNTHAMPLKMSGAQAAAKIQRGLLRNQPVIAFPWQLRWLAYFFNFLPRRLSLFMLRRH